MSIDTLIAEVASQSRIAAGLPVTWVVRQAPPNARLVSVPATVVSRSPKWTEDEDAFLRANLDLMSDEEIGQCLGRTAVAVRLRWKRDLGLTSRSKGNNEITAEQIAIGLGVDSKAVHRWIDQGFLPGRRLPLKTVIRVVNRTTLLRWVMTPRNWVYFKPARVGLKREARTKAVDWAWWKKVRRLLDLRRAQWNDEWWTSGQVAAHHQVDHRLVCLHASDGRLPAVKWNNWRIRKSDAVSHRFYVGKGNNWKGVFTERADCFLLLARAVGCSFGTIDALMQTESASSHLDVMKRHNAIGKLIRQYDLPIVYRRGHLLADWKKHEARFPRVAIALRRFESRSVLTADDRRIVANVFSAWLSALAPTQALSDLAWNLRYSSTITEQRLRRSLAQMRQASIDPFKSLTRQLPGRGRVAA